MAEIMLERIKENLESLKLKNTFDILHNYLECAVLISAFSPPLINAKSKGLLPCVFLKMEKILSFLVPRR